LGQFTKASSSLRVPKEVVDSVAETLKNNHKENQNFIKKLLERYQTEYQKYETGVEKAYDDYLLSSITKNKYEEKRKEYRTKQREIEEKMNKLHFADEEYYLASEYLLKLAANAGKLFESSEAKEKRLLLKLTLQNLKPKGKKVEFNWIKPFDVIANYASRQAWLEERNLNITKSFPHIIKVFEDFRFVQELREEIAKVKIVNSLS